jgi:hypothetical protein
MKPLASNAAFSPNAGSRREERRPARFLRHFEPFQGIADRKISPSRIRRPGDFPRTTKDVAPPFSSARRSPPLHRPPSNGGVFGEIPTRFRLFSTICGEESFRSLPAGAARVRCLDRCVALAKPSNQATAHGRATSDRERARSRRLGDLRQPPSRVRRLGSPAAGSTCGGGIFGRAWPRPILVIGGRKERIA